MAVTRQQVIYAVSWFCVILVFAYMVAAQKTLHSYLHLTASYFLLASKKPIQHVARQWFFLGMCSGNLTARLTYVCEGVLEDLKGVVTRLSDLKTYLVKGNVYTGYATLSLQFRGADFYAVMLNETFLLNDTSIDTGLFVEACENAVEYALRLLLIVAIAVVVWLGITTALNAFVPRIASIIDVVQRFPGFNLLNLMALSCYLVAVYPPKPLLAFTPSVLLKYMNLCTKRSESLLLILAVSGMITVLWVTWGHESRVVQWFHSMGVKRREYLLAFIAYWITYFSLPLYLTSLAITLAHVTGYVLGFNAMKMLLFLDVYIADYFILPLIPALTVLIASQAFNKLVAGIAISLATSYIMVMWRHHLLKPLSRFPIALVHPEPYTQPGYSLSLLQQHLTLLLITAVLLVANVLIYERLEVK